MASYGRVNANAVIASGGFKKGNSSEAAFAKTGVFTAETTSDLKIEVDGGAITVPEGTSLVMPGSATAGTDYVVWARPDGVLEVTSNYTSAPIAGSRRVGGFHYAPGSNASGVTGGNTTPEANEYSFWDLKFRPRASDPRGMTLVAGNFWADIYLCGVDHITDGTSKNNVTIADGSSPPKIPLEFGGNGSTAYSNLTWFVANEVLRSHGKRPPTYTEFATFAYGTTEAQSRGNDPITTGLGTTNTGSSNTDEEFTSKWGVIQAAGVLYVWGRDFIASGDGTGNWQTGLTASRGNIYTFNASARAGLFGGDWGDGSDAGSRCSGWGDDPSNSDDNSGARGVCDHLQLD